MKKYNASRRISSHLRKAVENTLAWHNYYVMAYFWLPEKTTTERRSKEKEFREANPSYKAETNKGTVTVLVNYRESAAKVYYSLTVWLGEEKKDIGLLKNLLK